MSVQLSTLLTVFFAATSLLQGVTLTVAAASDLSAIQPQLTAGFRKFEPNTELRFVNAASGVLTLQIENGAPYDIFLSANAEYIDRLSSNRKIDRDSVVTYALGQVGMLWRDGKVRQIKDLARVGSLALPNPKLAPYGVAAQKALESAGIWNFVRKKVVYGENVRQTLQLFDSGNADAVLTSASLLGGRKAVIIPSDPVVQKGGIVASSTNKEAAKRFLDFLTGPEGQGIFARNGFKKPERS
jgi:molybdate transport system substrate-binding protein